VRAPNRDRALFQCRIDLDKNYFNGLILVSVPRLEPEFGRRYRMPRSSYESVRAGLLEMDASFRQRPDASSWACLRNIPARLLLGRQA
jgi:hypothetical protein